MLIRLCVIGILLLSSIVHADDMVRVSRYGYVAPVATSAQADLLSVIVTISFNENIKNVGQALDHVLLRSGYRLADLSVSDPYLPILLSRPLPDVHRQLGPIRLNHALRTLAGSSWDLVLDPVHRLVSFELLSRYRREK